MTNDWMDPDEDRREEEPPEPYVAPMPKVPLKKQPPVKGRFLIVNLAAQRAKQLQQGALPRLPHLWPDPATGRRPVPTERHERIALDEIEQGMVCFTVPEAAPAKRR